MRLYNSSRPIDVRVQQLSGASGKNLLLSQMSWSLPDRIAWRGIDAKKSEANLVDAPLSSLRNWFCFPPPGLCPGQVGWRTALRIPLECWGQEVFDLFVHLLSEDWVGMYW